MIDAFVQESQKWLCASLLLKSFENGELPAAAPSMVASAPVLPSVSTAPVDRITPWTVAKLIEVCTDHHAFFR